MENKKIIPIPGAKRLVSRELDTAKDDLKEAHDSFERGGYKWSTIQSYYAMFHTARALLYHKGYKERSHFCLAVALEALYVETRILPEKYFRAFKNAMSLREDADYFSKFSNEGAKSIMKSANEFLMETEEILNP